MQPIAERAAQGEAECEKNAAAVHRLLLVRHEEIERGPGSGEFSELRKVCPAGVDLCGARSDDGLNIAAAAVCGERGLHTRIRQRQKFVGAALQTLLRTCPRRKRLL